MGSILTPTASVFSVWPRGGPWRIGLSIVRSILVAYLVVLLIMMCFEEAFIFHPDRYPQGDWRLPGAACENAWFQSADGVRLHGWYLPHDRSLATVLFCHGNGGNITHRADLAQLLHDRVGAAVLIFDYRGYGRSEGQPSERGILADARAARAWLALRCGIPQREIVVMGESLGGAVAVDLAACDGAKALVLQNTFNALPDVAGYHLPWLPVRWLMHTRLDSAAQIGRYHGPLLQCHGDADRTVPYRFGEKLFQAANEPKQFITHHGLDHNDFLPLPFFDTLKDFLEKLKDQ
jgi:hypothetical protein